MWFLRLGSCTFANAVSAPAFACVRSSASSRRAPMFNKSTATEEEHHAIGQAEEKTQLIPINSQQAEVKITEHVVHDVDSMTETLLSEVKRLLESQK